MARLRTSTNYNICKHLTKTLEKIGVWERNGFKKDSNGMSMEMAIRGSSVFAPNVADLGDLMFKVNKKRYKGVKSRTR